MSGCPAFVPALELLEELRGEFAIDAEVRLGHGAFGTVLAAVRRSDGAKVSRRCLAVTTCASRVKMWRRDPAKTCADNWTVCPTSDAAWVPVKAPAAPRPGFAFDDEDVWRGVQAEDARRDLFSLQNGIARTMFALVALGVAYLHAAGFVHWDINDENILVDAEYRARVIDLGSARPWKSRGGQERLFTSFHGTHRSSAPEVLMIPPADYCGGAPDACPENWAMRPISDAVKVSIEAVIGNFSSVNSSSTNGGKACERV
ncbi:kinase-like domain-containing protein [Zopfochytrium polystomum]|nr:kinase-like domain-containing protein [Zopfochytrium polystomum]